MLRTLKGRREVGSQSSPSCVGDDLNSYGNNTELCLSTSVSERSGLSGEREAKSKFQIAHLFPQTLGEDSLKSGMVIVHVMLKIELSIGVGHTYPKK